MQQRFSNITSDRLAAHAAELRERALRMAGSPERDQLLLEANRLAQAARIYGYLNSKELKPPT